MSIAEVVKLRRDQVLETARKHGVSEIWLIGSVARGESTGDSDVDFLIEAGEKTTPWFPGGLVADLEALLGCRVDIVERDALSAATQDNVLRDARRL